jgi:hypothetical protein
LDCIPINSNVIGHETFEIWIRNTILQHHDLVQLSPLDTLNIRVFKLHVTKRASIITL